VPDLATLAPPVAGQNGIALGSFLLYDGLDRVPPLRGGFDEWKRLGFPLEALKRTALA